MGDGFVVKTVDFETKVFSVGGEEEARGWVAALRAARTAAAREAGVGVGAHRPRRRPTLSGVDFREALGPQVTMRRDSKCIPPPLLHLRTSKLCSFLQPQTITEEDAPSLKDAFASLTTV